MAQAINNWNTAAAQAPMNAHLRDVCGVENNYLRNYIMKAGFRLPNAISSKSTTAIQQICMSVRKRPGDNNNYERKNIDADQQEKMEQTAHWCRYMYITGRPLDLTEATEERLEQVTSWMESLTDDSDESTVDKYKDGVNKRNWLESIQGYLATVKGAAKMPIAYVIRESDDPPAEDEGFGLPTFGSDLKARGRLNGRYFLPDNNKVWTFLRLKCHGTTAWTIISSFERQANGRMAFKALVAQFMGPDICNVLQSQAVEFLANAVFRGDNKNFPFDKFIGRMRQAFMDLGPNDQYTEQRKVRELMKAWQVSYLDSLDPHVLNHPQRSQNFEAAVSFLGDQLANRRVKHTTSGSGRNNRNISSLDRDGRTRAPRNPKKARGNSSNNGSKHKYDPRNPHKFLSGKAWWAMTDAQREEARKARLKRGIQPKTKSDRQVSALETEAEVQVEKVVPPPPKDERKEELIPLRPKKKIKMSQRHD